MRPPAIERLIIIIDAEIARLRGEQAKVQESIEFLEARFGRVKGLPWSDARRAAFRARLAQLGVSHRKEAIIRCLREHGPLTAVEIAAKLNDKTQSVNVSLADLRKNGVVEQHVLAKEERPTSATRFRWSLKKHGRNQS